MQSAKQRMRLHVLERFSQVSAQFELGNSPAICLDQVDIALLKGIQCLAVPIRPIGGLECLVELESLAVGIVDEAPPFFLDQKTLANVLA